MKMVEGPWLFSNFAAGWAFAPLDADDLAAGIADRIGVRLLRRDIEARIAAYAEACTNPDVIAAIEDLA